MAEPDKRPVTLQELLVSSLAQTDALAKLLIEKGLISASPEKQWEIPKGGNNDDALCEPDDIHPRRSNSGNGPRSLRSGEPRCTSGARVASAARATARCGIFRVPDNSERFAGQSKRPP